MTPRIEVQSLAQVFLVANTPAYLVKHFRRSDSVQRLANEASTEELVQLYERAAGNRTLDELTVLGYAALVALTLQNTNKARRALQQLSGGPHLDWGPRIIQQFFLQPVAGTAASPRFSSVGLVPAVVVPTNTPLNLTVTGTTSSSGVPTATRMLEVLK